MLQAGTKAPGFTLNDKEGNPVSLADFAGKKVVLYFYPRDNTPGCTRQACAFRDAWPEYERRGVAVIGVSKDSERSHRNFAEKQGLPFLLLADPALEAIQAYDVWKEKKLYGKVSMGVARTTYVIDENGMIEKVFEKAKPDTNDRQAAEQHPARCTGGHRAEKGPAHREADPRACQAYSDQQSQPPPRDQGDA